MKLRLTMSESEPWALLRSELSDRWPVAGSASAEQREPLSVRALLAGALSRVLSKVKVYRVLIISHLVILMRI